MPVVTIYPVPRTRSESFLLWSLVPCRTLLTYFLVLPACIHVYT